MPSGDTVLVTGVANLFKKRSIKDMCSKCLGSLLENTVYTYVVYQVYIYTYSTL